MLLNSVNLLDWWEVTVAQEMVVAVRDIDRRVLLIRAAEKVGELGLKFCFWC